MVFAEEINHLLDNYPLKAYVIEVVRRSETGEVRIQLSGEVTGAFYFTKSELYNYRTLEYYLPKFGDIVRLAKVSDGYELFFSSDFCNCYTPRVILRD